MGLGIDVRGGTHRCTAVAVFAIRISFGTTRTTVIANVDGAISCDVTEMLLAAVEPITEGCRSCLNCTAFMAYSQD